MPRSRRNLVLLAVLFLVIALAGCGDRASFKAAPADAPATAQASVAAGPSGRAMAGAPAQQAEPAADAQAAQQDGRHIAYTHRYTVEAERAKLRTVVDAHAARCKQLDCVVINQSFEEESDHTAPRAMLMVRVARNDTAKFTEALKTGEGRVIRQATQAEDKTLQVVDVQARIANLTQLRDRLRKLMADPKAGIKEAVEIERQLAQTQGELDSMQAQRRFLAQQTERELFEIQYQSQRSAVERGIAAPVKEALLSFGNVFMYSVAALITFFAAAIVWIVLLGIAVWFFRRWLRRRAAAKNIE
ncbi:MAG: DUF4349 domain-containing protein [Betaproteobacteria bacterium]|nr:DUF4349 domain-containing protein [Betaproteobacteria bacterium]